MYRVDVEYIQEVYNKHIIQTKYRYPGLSSITHIYILKHRHIPAAAI